MEKYIGNNQNTCRLSDNEKCAGHLSGGVLANLERDRTREGRTVTEILNLRSIHSFLKEATDVQPCPGCKHDMQVLLGFVEEKMKSFEDGWCSWNAHKESLRKLREIDYLNEMTDVAIFATKILGPVANLLSIAAPEGHRKVLEEDTPANRVVLENLYAARETSSALRKIDADYAKIDDIIAASIRAVNFKLSIDTRMFYLFDKVIRTGHKVHLLGFTGKAIVTLRSAFE